MAVQQKHYSARLAYLPSGLCDVLLFLLFIYFNGPLSDQLSQNILDQMAIFTRFSGLLDVWVQMNELMFIFQSLLWQNQFCDYQQNWPIPPSFVLVALQNGLEDRSANVPINSGDDPSVSNRNLVSFHSLTSEFI